MSEVGGFGVSRPDDLLYVEDIQTVEQVCTIVIVNFNDDAVARFFDDQVDAGRKPEQFARIWIHTHPEISAQPSCTDEETFSRVFGRADWTVMFILSKTGETYCRLRFNVGPGGEIEIPVGVDYRSEFASSDFLAWEAEYQANVRIMSDPRKARPIEDFRLEAGKQQPRDSTEWGAVESADASLRDYLQRYRGWSSEEIDGQLELGWSLEDLVDFGMREDEELTGFSNRSRTESLTSA